MAHHLMEFYIVDHRSAYHGGLERPTLIELWVVTSFHHLYIKFPTDQSFAIVRFDQMGLRECYLSSLWKSKPRSTNMVLIDAEMLDAFVEGPTPE